MGRMLGAFDQENDMIDRPDLNKCPECGCFFAQDECPLCGKTCPEEMKAGNRKPPKKQKYKYDNGYRTVMFVNWYHRWWFILLTAFIHPLISIVLLITSPHKKAHKIIAVCVAVLYGIITNLVIPFYMMKTYIPDPPVDTSLSKQEYISLCEEVSPEEFYRTPDKYNDKFVSMELVIVEKFYASYDVYDTDVYEQLYNTYYVCKDSEGGTFTILMRNCLQEGDANFIANDVITIYGEGAGDVIVYAENGTIHRSPCVNAAYAYIE